MSKELDLHVHVCVYSPADKNTLEKSVLLKEKTDHSWSQIVQQLQKQLTLSVNPESSWAFQYFDDEGDMIFGKTEEEWREAVTVGCEVQGNRNTLHISAFPMKPSSDKKETGGNNKEGCCAKTCDAFCRPIPPLPPQYDSIPNKVTNLRQSEYKYGNEALRAVALPLGALGGGSIALAGDGGLRQWQICNAVNHVGIAPDSFFAIRVDQGGTKAVALQSNTWYDQKGFTPSAFITDHVVPDASKKLLSEIPGIKTLEITAKFPIVEVDYLSSEVPVQVHLEAFSPKVFLDSKNSAIPVIVFNFTVTNTGSQEAEVSLLGSLQNIAGWDGVSDITDEVSNPGYGGNVNSLFQNSTMHGIDMSNPTLQEKTNSNGHVAMVVMTKKNDKLSNDLQYTKVADMWKKFIGSGLSGQEQVGPSPAHMTWNGATCCTRTIPANSEETFTFLLAWYFPHRYVNWSQPGGINDPNSDFYIGNQYSNFWKNGIKEVLTYTGENLDDLTSKTRAFRDCMFNSTLPWQMIDSAAGRVSVLNSPTCMWHADGNFYGFEGCNKFGGCCPLNCTHVWNYEMALAKCYPDVERTMRKIDYTEQMTPHDVIPSRTVVPLILRRIWTNWENYSAPPSSTSICVDGDIGTVLKTYREVKQGAPRDWFDKYWPYVKRVMERWMTELDNGKGLITGAQPNTYDCAIYGVNVYIGGYYLAALRAAEEMATLQGDNDLAASYHKRFELGSENLDKLCFNGKWYIQVVDPKNPVNEVADSTWVDCLVGQWWAHALGLGYILKKENVKSTLRYVFEKNHIDSFIPANQKPRPFFDQRDSGMQICVYPGTIPQSPLLYHSEGAWTGLEYEFAELCLYEGLNDIALKVLTDTRNKYDGTRRSPWNEIECGDHYARPMASFLLFEIASGQEWSFNKDDSSFLNLRFAPRLCQTDFRGFFILGSCWGQYVQKGDEGLTKGTVEISVRFGELKLAELHLASRATKAMACVTGSDAKPISMQVNQNEKGLTIKVSLGSPFREVKAGSSLIIELSG